MSAPTRRTVVRTASWTLPVIAAMGAAPAFATSQPVACTVTARWYELARRRNRYKLTVGCSSPVLSVTIDGKQAERLPKPNDAWWAIERTTGGDRNLVVTVTTKDGTWTRTIRFTEWGS